MTKDLQVSTRKVGAVWVIDIVGDLTAQSGSRVEESYRSALGEGARQLLLAFTADCYINSGGIAILIGVVAQGIKQGQVIGMTGLTPHFQKIFAMVGLTRYAKIHPSEEAALAALGG